MGVSLSLNVVYPNPQTIFFFFLRTHPLHSSSFSLSPTPLSFVTIFLPSQPSPLPFFQVAICSLRSPFLLENLSEIQFGGVRIAVGENL